MFNNLTMPNAANILRIVSGAEHQAQQQGLQQALGRPQSGQSGQTTQTRTAVQQMPSLPAPGTQLTGLVTAQGARGLHTLTFPNGQTVQVQATSNMPLGAQVQVEVLNSGAARIMGMSIPAGTAQAQTLAQMTRQWDNLRDALNELRKSDPQAAKQVAQRLPSFSGNFLASLFGFQQAVKTGNLAKLLGNDLLAALQNAGRGLEDDMASLNNLTQKQNTPEHWRTLIFPYVEDENGDPHQGSFFWRHQAPENEAGADHVRFVVNVSLSQMGPVQVDGLMVEKDIHIKVRLQVGIAQEDIRELEKLTAKTLSSLGLTGDITVEKTSYFEVDPLHDMLKSQQQLNVNV